MYKFEVLKEKIDSFIANGGDIYLPKNDLPYYSYLSQYKRSLEIKENKEYTIPDIYKMCGITFDKDFYLFTKLNDKIKEYIDEDNCVDKIREGKDQEGSAYKILRYLARKANCSLTDYIMFMTPYSVKEANANVDYVAYLQKDLLEAYPSKYIYNIKRDNQDLYEKIRHLKRCLGNQYTMQQVVTELGFTNEYFKNNIGKTLSEKEILQKLNKTCPNMDASNLLERNQHLYYEIIKLAIQQDTTIKKWLIGKGYNYSFGGNVEKLSLYKVNPEKRRNELFKKKKELMSKIASKSRDTQELYHFNTELLKQTVSELSFDVYKEIERLRPVSQDDYLM